MSVVPVLVSAMVNTPVLSAVVTAAVVNTTMMSAVVTAAAMVSAAMMAAAVPPAALTPAGLSATAALRRGLFRQSQKPPSREQGRRDKCWKPSHVLLLSVGPCRSWNY